MPGTDGGTVRLAIRAAAAVVLSLGVALPAHADGTLACSSVLVSGTTSGNHIVGPYCVPSQSAPKCEHFDGGLDPDANVYIDVCVPQ
jgi:hypothetical protein